jgi:hypothetical protein
MPSSVDDSNQFANILVDIVEAPIDRKSSVYQQKRGRYSIGHLSQYRVEAIRVPLPCYLDDF